MSVSAPPHRRTEGVTRTPMDPRVRARRIAVAKAEGRRRLHRVIGVVVVALLMLTGWGVLHSPLVSVQHVQVEGLERLSVPEVVAAGGLRRGQLLVSLDAAEVAAGVATLAPVGRVQVTRRWPRTVRITVVERLPLLAAALADGTTALVDSTGRTIDAVPEPPAGLVRVEGPTPVGPVGSSLPAEASTAVSAAAAIPPSLAAQIEVVRWNADGTASIGLLGDRTALLGSAATVPEQFLALATVLAAGGLPEGATVDLRVPRAPVVVPDGCIPGQGACSP
jgi:cell division protein FtsQ